MKLSPDFVFCIFFCIFCGSFFPPWENVLTLFALLICKPTILGPPFQWKLLFQRDTCPLTTPPPEGCVCVRHFVACLGKGEKKMMRKWCINVDHASYEQRVSCQPPVKRINSFGKKFLSLFDLPVLRFCCFVSSGTCCCWFSDRRRWIRFVRFFPTKIGPCLCLRLSCTPCYSFNCFFVLLVFNIKSVETCFIFVSGFLFKHFKGKLKLKIYLQNCSLPESN